MTGSKPEHPDSPPKHLYIGAINPFALCEAILGRKLDWGSPATASMISSILQTDYEELFDMRFGSILYAGIRMNDREDMAELIPAKDMHTLTERDLVTPDFSRVEKLGDLANMGLKDLNAIRVKHAFMSNGNLRLTLEPQTLGKTLCNSEMTTTLRELATPFRVHKKEEWTPPNSSWTDIEACYRQDALMFNDPVQGATSNSWLIAALMAVAWADPSAIVHCTRSSKSSSGSNDEVAQGEAKDDASGRDASHHGRREGRKHECSLTVRFHSKGGDNDAPTSTVTVNCEVPVNNSSSLLVYCRPSSMNMIMWRGAGAGGPMGEMGMMHPGGMMMMPPISYYYTASGSTSWGGEIWPALYEKAFAKWVTRASSGEEHPDITQTSHGDPVKCMAQLTDKEPQYFFTAHRRAQDLLGLVRTHCVNLRTIYPMVAFTYPTGDKFRGCTLVGNMAYTVLGWAAPQERKQYIILRHAWGVTEPEGMTGYPGLVPSVDVKFWPPIKLIDSAGVFAIETGAFKEYFAGLGVAK